MTQALPPPDLRLPALNEASPEGHAAMETACVHQCLDDRGVPREEGGRTLSLWGRVTRWNDAPQVFNIRTTPPPSGPILVWYRGVRCTAAWTDWNGSHTGCIAHMEPPGCDQVTWRDGGNSFYPDKPEWWMPMPAAPAGRDLTAVHMEAEFQLGKREGIEILYNPHSYFGGLKPIDVASAGLEGCAEVIAFLREAVHGNGHSPFLGIGSLPC